MDKKAPVNNAESKIYVVEIVKALSILYYRQFADFLCVGILELQYETSFVVIYQ